MTEKKKLNTILIVIVLGLWGTVAYKTISRFFYSKDLVLNQSAIKDNLDFDRLNKEDFQLEKIIRDPFLDRLIISDSIVKIRSPQFPLTRKPNAIKVIPPITWPAISYYGYIKSSAKQEELVLVKINGILFRLRKNDSVGDIVLKTVYKDSIELEYNKQKRTVRSN